MVIASAGQGEIEDGAASGFAFGPYPPPMPRHDALHDCEADPRTRKLFDAVQALKDAEELVVIAHIESDAVILDTVHRFILQFLTAYPHAWLIAFGGVLDRIADKINPDLAQHRAIARGRRQRVHLDSGGMTGSSPQFHGNFLCKRHHVDRY